MASVATSGSMVADLLLVGPDLGRDAPDQIAALVVVEHVLQHLLAVRDRRGLAERLGPLEIARIALVVHRSAHRGGAGAALLGPPDRPADLGQQRPQAPLPPHPA